MPLSNSPLCNIPPAIMSKITKLSIVGVRSFDPRNPMTIEFNTPLTLIVGMNGSGKTTIIECLKFVTSGMLPPNSNKGSSFVHDPKMAGEKEIDAQIKIQFVSAEGLKMVTTRNMRLTVKKATRSYKQLEGSIRMAKDGERNTISSRVGEMSRTISSPVFVIGRNTLSRKLTFRRRT